MKIIDILTSPWAIVPAKLYEIQEIYSTHLRGEKIDLAAVEAMVREKGPGFRGQRAEVRGQGSGAGDQEEKAYQVIDGVALIEINGVIAKRMNLFTRISGGVSTQLVARDIRDAVEDADISGILLDVDSPGGTVDGTQELADIVRGARDIKPVVAYSDGMMASAAYWIGSAAQEIYISGDTPEIGSIGVVATHVDYSKYEEKSGIKTTEIFAGKYKRIASQYQPLSEEGRQSIQDQVDYLYSVFVEDIAKNRGTSPGTVLKDMADGRIFIGRQAIRAGLVDGVSTFEQALGRLAVLRSEMEQDKELQELNRRLQK